MPSPTLFAKYLLAIPLVLTLCACGSNQAKDDQEPHAISEKLRWYWMGSISYQEHTRPEHPENYWLEINDDKAVFQADCNHGSGKASATKEGRLWIEKIATARIACAKGSLENIYLKQLADVNISEQRGDVTRIILNQYGEAMYFSRTPDARFSSYRCQGGEALVLIAQGSKLNIWIGEDFRSIKPDGDPKPASGKLTEKENDKPAPVEDGIESLLENCRKVTPK